MGIILQFRDIVLQIESWSNICLINGVLFMNVEKKLTRFERARLLGARAIQISMGARPLVDIKDSLDPIDIAYEELKAGVLPLDVTRDE